MARLDQDAVGPRQTHARMAHVVDQMQAKKDATDVASWRRRSASSVTGVVAASPHGRCAPAYGGP